MQILLCMSLLAVSCLCGCGQKEKIILSETYDTENCFGISTIYLRMKFVFVEETIQKVYGCAYYSVAWLILYMESILSRIICGVISLQRSF